jgi:hypothetical protein
MGGRARQLLDVLTAPRHLRPVMRTPGMISLDEAALLFELAHNVREGAIVEVGSYRGRSTAALALGARSGGQAAVFAIEPHEAVKGVLGGTFGPEDRAWFYRMMLRTRCYREVRLVNLSSHEVVPGWQHGVGLLWIDGDHTIDGVRRDLNSWRRHLLPGAIVAFDDCDQPSLGPAVVVSEELDARRMTLVKQTGKMTVVRSLS